MNLVKFGATAAVAALAWQAWHHHASHAQRIQTAGLSASVRGFVPLPPPDSVDMNKVQIVAPANCPREAGQRADAMERQLHSRGIPYDRIDSVHFSFDQPDPAGMERLNTVMNGDLPVVMIRGRGKNNPGIDEVLAEYRAQ